MSPGKTDRVGQTTSKGCAQPELILIGLGNPILGDDGVGWRIVEEAQKLIRSCQAEKAPEFDTLELDIEFLSLGGLSLMERMIGYQKAVLVDAISTGNVPVGTIMQFQLQDLPLQASGHLASAHDTSLQDAIEIGKRLGAHLPDIIHIIAVEARLEYEFSEALSEEVSAAVPQAVYLVMQLLKQFET